MRPPKRLAAESADRPAGCDVDAAVAETTMSGRINHRVVSDELSHYRAYGLTIQSDLSLPELHGVDSVRGSPDIVIRTGDVEALCASADDAVDLNTVRFDSVGAFAVVDGHEILYDLHSSDLRQYQYVRRIVYNKALPVALLQRGSVVLHASAVVIDGQAAIFLGSRSTGKSTTAAAFHLQGHSVLADDIVGIRPGDGAPTVLSGVPQLRLEPEVVAALDIDETATSSQSARSEKQYLNLTPVADTVPVGCFYLLAEGESVAIESLAGTEQFFQVVKRTFHDGFLSEDRMTPTGFQQCSTVIDASPVRYLRRPRRYEALPSVVKRVVRDLTAEETAAE